MDLRRRNDALALQKGFANGLDIITTKANSGPKSEQAA
jgi:hypothetical protein